MSKNKTESKTIEDRCEREPKGTPRDIREREGNLKMAMAHIRKQYGPGAVMLMGQQPQIDIRGISTGSIGLDMALGGKGLPCGRIAEIFGPESSGKTTLALQLCAQAQKKGGTIAYIDAEHAMDVQYAKKLGLNVDEMLLSQPDYGEQALDIAEALVKSNAVDVIVIDSVAALIPKAELDGEMGDSHVGLHARLMSQALRKLTAVIARSETIVIFINQIRQKIGVSWGSPETTPGGRALKFYSSVRLDIRRIGSVKQGEQILGNEVQVKVIKNKIAAPFKTAKFDIMFGEGISYEGELIDLGEEFRLLKKTGSWFSYDNERVGQGRENVKQYLKEHKAAAEKLEGEIRQAIQEREARKGKPNLALTDANEGSGADTAESAEA